MDPSLPLEETRGKAILAWRWRDWALWTSKYPKLALYLQIFKTEVKTRENHGRSKENTQDRGRGGGDSPWPTTGKKARPFSAKGPFYSGWPDHVRGPNVPPHACHVRRPNLTFGGRTWTSLTHAFGGLTCLQNACMFSGRTWLSAAEPGFSSKDFSCKNSFNFLLKNMKYMKTFHKIIVLPF